MLFKFYFQMSTFIIVIINKKLPMYNFNFRGYDSQKSIFEEQESLIIRTQPIQPQSCSLFFESQEQKKFKSCQISESSSEIKEEKYLQDRRKVGHNQLKQKSVHHNSQKQAVITFKHLVKLSFDGSESEVHQLAKRMWLQFLSSHNQSKELLSIVFGCEQSEQKKMGNRIRKYGFSWLKQFDQNSIKLAQKLLRTITTEQITSTQLENHIKIRKINEKQGFRFYMLNLVQQLKNGPILRRLDREKSTGITNIILTDRLLNLSD